MSSFAPSRRFSQNFLTDVTIARRIVDALEASSEDAVIEIGPGKGALTVHLHASAAKQVVALELDHRAVEYLQSQSWLDGVRMSVLETDALKVQLVDVLPRYERTHRRVVGNLPYAITSPLLFWAFDQRADVGRAVFMMQREVARRCVAEVGTKDYGILSVACWLYSSAKILFHVQPGSFFPRPSVTSSVVRFDMHETTSMGLPAAEFMDFVRGAFSQRRKVMSNSLADWAARKRVDLRMHSRPAGVDLSKTRAEECNPSLLGRMFFDLQPQVNGHIANGGVTSEQ